MTNIKIIHTHQPKPQFNNHAFFSFLTVFMLVSMIAIGILGGIKAINESHEKTELENQASLSLAVASPVKNIEVYKDNVTGVIVYAAPEPAPITINK
ncbi:hypothetical protein [Pseudomonas ficuserectae]|uniref:hypothetical protein n=1 Tax=Pseudomonas ficuserectae TaxID=53410 RepID=UPI000AB2D450|nr:hypothetical protein [Pseudomonas ficuserectae]